MKPKLSKNKKCDICGKSVPLPLKKALEIGWQHQESMAFWGRSGEEFKARWRCPECVKKYGDLL